MPARPRELLKEHDLHEIKGTEDLWECAICHCVSGTLLDSCPGHPLDLKTQNDIEQGKVRDLLSYREMKVFKKDWGY